MQNFIDTIHCKSRSHCLTCRQKEEGRDFRESLYQNFKLPDNKIDFECPYGKKWIETPLTIEGQKEVKYYDAINEEVYSNTYTNTAIIIGNEDDEETTLDDVNILEEGLGDDSPTCNLKTNPKTDFEECDKRYGFDIICYLSVKSKFSNTDDNGFILKVKEDNELEETKEDILQLLLYRGQWAINDQDPPLSCGYSFGSHYSDNTCGNSIEFEDSDTLLDTEFAIPFFIEHQEGESDEGEELPDYIYQMGHSGVSDLYTAIDHPYGLNADSLNDSLSLDNRDFNGLFSENNPAYWKENKRSIYDVDEWVKALSGRRNNLSENLGITPQRPDAISRNTFSLIYTNEILIVNSEFVISQVLADEDESGIIVDLGNIFPLNILFITTEPVDITEEDILEGDIPSISENLFESYIINNDFVELRGDFYKNESDLRSCSKFLGGYKFDFNENAVKDNITRKVLGDDSPDRKINHNNFNHYIGNSINSTKIKLSSGEVGEKVYITGFVSSKLYGRTIHQVHILTDNDRPDFQLSNIGYNIITGNTGNYVPLSSSPQIKTESIDFGLFCHEVDNKRGFEWRMTGIPVEGDFIWKRWKKTRPFDNPILREFLNFEPMFYTGDSEGIKLYSVNLEGDFKSKLLLSKDEILLQDWYESYLSANDLEDVNLDDKLTFNKNSLNSDIEFTKSFTQNLMFDISDLVNNNLSDHDKIPYSLCFAAALNKIDKNNTNQLIGINRLDFIQNDINLNNEELSGSEETSTCIEGIKLGLSSLNVLLNYYLEKELEKASEIIELKISEKNTINISDLAFAQFRPNITNNTSSNSSMFSELSGFQKNYLIRKFSDFELDSFESKMKRNFGFRSTLGPFGTRGSQVSLNESEIDFYSGISVPPGKYLISYISGGLASGSGVGIPLGDSTEEDLEASTEEELADSILSLSEIGSFFIQNPDTDCDGIYVQFNSYAPCRDVLFIAPGSRESFDSIDELQGDNEGLSRFIYHLGGKITLKLVVNENPLVGCASDSTCPTYCIDPKDLSPIISNQWVDANFTHMKVFTTFDLFNQTTFDLNTRIYIETFGIDRQFDEPHNSSLQDYGYLHPQFNCVGLYPDHPVENISVRSKELINNWDLEGVISINQKYYRNNAFLTTPEFNTNSISYHIVDFEKNFSWSKNGLSPDEATGKSITASSFTSGFILNQDNSIEFINQDECEEETLERRIRGRADQIVSEEFISYNRGRLINSSDGAIYLRENFDRTNLPNSEEAFLVTDGSEFEERSEDEENITGWIKKLTLMSLPQGSLGTIDNISIQPNAERLSTFTNEQNLEGGTLFSEQTNFVIEDGLHNINGITYGENDDLENFEVDVRYGRIKENKNFFTSAGKIKSVTYLKDEFFEKFKVKRSSVHSTIVDDKNRILVFYENDKNNISIAVSQDDGLTWFNIDSIIRLSVSESARKPYAIVNYSKKTVSIIFLYNELYLAHKEISTQDIDIEDAFISYYPLKFTQGFSKDFGLEQFTKKGKQLRNGFFSLILGGISRNSNSCGDIEDFVNNPILDKNSNPRIIAIDFENWVKEDITNIEYAAYIDKRGGIKLFYTLDREFIHIKSTFDYKAWIFTQRFLTITHLPFVDSEKTYDLDESCEEFTIGCRSFELIKCNRNNIGTLCNPKGITKIQIVYDYIKDIVHFIYIYNNGLFVRKILGSDIANSHAVELDESWDKDTDESNKNNTWQLQWSIRNKLSLRETSPNKPVFIAGNRPDDQLFEIYDYRSLTAPLTGVFPIIRPDGFINKYGQLKLFYFDKNLTLWGITLQPDTLLSITSTDGPCRDLNESSENVFGNKKDSDEYKNCNSGFPWIINSSKAGSDLLYVKITLESIEENEKEESCILNLDYEVFGESYQSNPSDCKKLCDQYVLSYQSFGENDCNIDGEVNEYILKVNLTKAYIDGLWPDSINDPDNLFTQIKINYSLFGDDRKLNILARWNDNEITEELELSDEDEGEVCINADLNGILEFTDCE